MENCKNLRVGYKNLVIAYSFNKNCRCIISKIALTKPYSCDVCTMRIAHLYTEHTICGCEVSGEQ